MDSTYSIETRKHHALLAKEKGTMVNVEQILCMKAGDGEASYASNSSYQRGVMSNVKRRIEDTLADIYKSISPKCLVVADLGCASGPNTLLIVLQIMNAMRGICHEMKQEIPDVQVFLNDLPSNDFNNIFKSLPDLYLKLEEQSKSCFVAAMPGSFYGRLFPSNSLHFVHSSSAVHWLSQVPQGLVSENGEPLNKGNICITKTSSTLVQKMYLAQFEKDFQLFLKLRSKEIVLGGGMVVTLPCSVDSDRTNKSLEIVGLTLSEMANEGLVEKSTIDMFNMPVYMPSVEEIRKVICDEGSFFINGFECFDLPWKPQIPKEVPRDETCVKNYIGKFVANTIRAFSEPLLAPVFGDSIMDDLFRRIESKSTELMNTMEMKYKEHIFIFTLKKMK